MNHWWFASDLITPDGKPRGTPEMNTRKPRMASWRTTTHDNQFQSRGLRRAGGTRLPICGCRRVLICF